MDVLADIRGIVQEKPMTDWYLKDWKMLQSYQRKKPTWVKLPIDLLYDPRWMRLSDRQAKALITIWMIVAEHGTDGALPPLDQLSAKLRATHLQLTHNSLPNLIRQLNQHGFITMSSPETEAENRDREKKT